MWRRTRSSDAGREAPGRRRSARRRLGGRWIGWALAACASVACGGLLDIESPRRVFEAAGGDGQGEAGDATGGAVGGKGGRGGLTGTGGGSGSTGTSGGGGSSGAATGGAAGDSGGTAGSSGAKGGTGGEPPGPGPTLGDACAVENAVSCTSANRNIVLRCVNRTWKLDASCAQNFRCSAEDPGNLGCAKIDQECILNGTYCRSDGQLFDCDTDPFYPTTRICPFGCEAGRCLPGAPDELIVHDELVVGVGSPWPGDIPVCFLDSEQQLDGWMQDELDRSWARYLNVRFTGFALCPRDAVPGVAIEYLDDCRGRLGSSFSFGDPGVDMQVRVGFCASYFDAEGYRKFMETEHEALFRFLVRHQFGHVLGLAEVDFVREDSTMVRGLVESQAEAHSVSALDLFTLLSDYGRKEPSGSFVTSRGQCLKTVGSELGQTECPDAGRFILEGGQLKSLPPGTAGCVVAKASGEVTLGACGDGTTAFRFDRMRWSTISACAVPGRPVALGPCNPSTLSLDWSLDVRLSDSQKLTARIRSSGQCLTLPDDVQWGDAPLLQPCDDEVAQPSELFGLWPNGRITIALPGSTGSPLALCWEAGVLRLGDCSQVHWFSGPLEVNGLVLDAVPGQTSSIQAVRLDSGGYPSSDQMFDFIF